MTSRIDRPWGSEDLFSLNEPVTVKLLYVKSGEELSLQYHKKRAEFWKIISGCPEVVIGDETRRLEAGDEVSIAEGEKHRIMAPDGEVVVLEISRGEFDENDEVKLEDKYGRV
jgi:mannose-1-phosphate guanylyltransferase